MADVTGDCGGAFCPLFGGVTNSPVGDGDVYPFSLVITGRDDGEIGSGASGGLGVSELTVSVDSDICCSIYFICAHGVRRLVFVGAYVW